LNPCDLDTLRQLAGGWLPEAKLRELEDHLQACSPCREALDRLAASDRWVRAVRHYLGKDSGPSPETIFSGADGLDFLAPSDWPESLGRLGHYEIKGILGRGGMAVVLKAIDPALNRTVAIKVLASHLATCGASRQRFLREARAAAAVVHEHVVAVYAVDESAGLPYLVMEYVPGRSLQERLDQQGALSLPEILRIGIQAASGLAAAHAQGLVHRDVKPANILLENGVERVRLTDFGLARAVADAAFTQSGVVAGTPQYMAPEQARGESVDHRADLFSLGSTLYAMCTGHPPFRAESAVAVLRRVSDDEPRPIRELNAEVPSWLAALIGRLQAKDPNERIQTAAEVAGLLARCLAHVQQPLAVPLPQALVDPAGSAGSPRRRLRVPLALLLLTTLVGVLGVLVWQYWPKDMPVNDAAVSGTSVAPGVRRAGPLNKQSDELDEQLRELSQQVDSIEAVIVRWNNAGPQDAVSKQVHRLVEEAGSLERQIIATPGISTDRFSPTPTKGDNP
jgi:serine/threonine-protein kinase